MLLQQSEQNLILEIQMPNILLGIQVFWELRLYDKQLRKAISLRYRLSSGKNRIHLPLDAQQKKNLRQLQRGYYQSNSQVFFVRDCFSCLHMRYHIKQELKLAVLSSNSTLSSIPILPDSHSRAQLDTVVHKLAQESLHEQRPYYPGDDPRRINWKLYSRFNELYVRIPEEEQLHSQDIHYYLLLDMTCYPKSLHSSVLDLASTFFLGQVKQLHQSGCRVVVHMPAKYGPEFTDGLLYNEASEERVLTALAAYPLNSSLQADSPENPMLQMLSNLETNLETKSSNSHIVFCSPHSISHNFQTDTLEDYFPKKQSIFIPVPEPSKAIQTELCSGSALGLLRLLPAALFWQWLLRTPGLLSQDTRQFYQKMGTTAGKYANLQARSYPSMLWRLATWRSYYKKPEKRYLKRDFKRAK